MDDFIGDDQCVCVYVCVCIKQSIMGEYVDKAFFILVIIYSVYKTLYTYTCYNEINM